MSPAVDNMAALAALLTQTDLLGLREIPALADEPVKYPAEVDRVKKQKMACRLPFKKDGIMPCPHPTFTHFDALKKHFNKEHSEAQKPKWTKKRGGKPVGYEDVEEDTGPMVMCRSVSSALLFPSNHICLPG